MKNIILKVISLIIAIIPIIVFIIEFERDENSINFIAFIILELINIFIVIYLFRKENVSKVITIAMVCYIVISVLIPIYNRGYTYAPTGQNSELMGVAWQEVNRDIYGIDISKILDIFR